LAFLLLKKLREIKAWN